MTSTHAKPIAYQYLSIQNRTLISYRVPTQMTQSKFRTFSAPLEPKKNRSRTNPNYKHVGYFNKKNKT